MEIPVRLVTTPALQGCTVLAVVAPVAVAVVVAVVVVPIPVLTLLVKQEALVVLPVQRPQGSKASLL